MSRDVRGWRVALLPDLLVNPPPGSPPLWARVVGILETCGYGLLQLPPPGAHARLLAVIADQVAEYAHHGYALVAIGIERAKLDPPPLDPASVDTAASDPLHWRRLASLLRRRDTAVPARFRLRAGDSGTALDAEAMRLRTFLEGHDLPADEQRRWRV